MSSNPPPAPTRTIPSRIGFACLLALAMVMPLMPVEGRGASVKHIVFLGVGALGLAAVWLDAIRQRRSPQLGTPVDLALGAFFIALVPSVALSQNAGMSRYAAGLMVGLGLVYVLAVKTVRSPNDVRQLFGAVFLAGVVVAAVGLEGYRRFLADGAPEDARRFYLSTPFFLHSYLAAQYLVMVFAGGAVVLLRAGLARPWRVALTGGLLIIGAFLAVIGSRGAYAAVAVALVTSVVLHLRSTTGRHRIVSTSARALALVAGIALVAATVTLLGSGRGAPGLQTALQPVARPMSFSRLAVWQHTVEMAADHLVTGVGLGSFDTMLPRYHYTSEPVPHAHNQFLDVLAEGGLLALLAFLFVLGTGTRAARRGARDLHDDQDRRPLFLAAVAAMSAALVYFLFETPLEWVEAGSLIMILLAVVTRAGCTTREGTTSTAAAMGGVLLLSGLLAFVVPAWRSYFQATTLAADHGQRLAIALEARANGEDDRAAADLQELVRRLGEADELFPYRADFARMMADALVRFERYEAALLAYRLADQRVPGTFESLNAIGRLLLRLDRPTEAIDPLRLAVISHRGMESVETYALLGRAYMRARQNEEAWIVYDDLINRHYYHMEQPRILKEAAWTLVALDRYLTLAAIMLEEYQALVPDDHGPELEGLVEHVANRLAQPRKVRLPPELADRASP